MLAEHFAINDLFREMGHSVRFSPKIAAYLALRGWYFLFTFPFGSLAFLKGCIDKSDHHHLEEVMREFIRSQTSRIEAILCYRFPSRITIIKDAFEAHKARKYTL